MADTSVVQVWRERGWIHGQPTLIMTRYINEQENDWDTIVLAKRRNFYEVYGHNTMKFEELLSLPTPPHRNKLWNGRLPTPPLNGFPVDKLESVVTQLEAQRAKFKVIDLSDA